MKPKPIPFSPAMILALLDGKKTETRRLVFDQQHPEACRPPWAAGDVLYVKEPFRLLKTLDSLSPRQVLEGAHDQGSWLLHYEADGAQVGALANSGAPLGRYRHARYMPRDWARVKLRVLEVRQERLHNIDHGSAIAEGMHSTRAIRTLFPDSLIQNASDYNPLGLFWAVWKRLHGPVLKTTWVWVVRFEVLS